MANPLFNKYIWLAKTIYDADGITLKKIQEKWSNSEMSNGEELAERTFHNHRKAIQELFDINIECSKAVGYKYKIENKEAFKNKELRFWLLDTFSVSTLISESLSLKDRILIDDIPSGHTYLPTLIEAMRKSKCIELTYKSYWRDKANTFSIEPYCIKIFKQRWYVVARSPYYNDIRIYSLDRISHLNILDKTFTYPNKKDQKKKDSKKNDLEEFDPNKKDSNKNDLEEFYPESYFRFSYGVIVDTKDPTEKVQLKVYGKKCKYLKALPFHYSQKEIETTNDYSIFEYELNPTYDFCQEILSHGSDIEVLAPLTFREEIAEKIRNAASLYAEK